MSEVQSVVYSDTHVFMAESETGFALPPAQPFHCPTATATASKEMDRDPEEGETADAEGDYANSLADTLDRDSVVSSVQPAAGPSGQTTAAPPFQLPGFYRCKAATETRCLLEDGTANTFTADTVQTHNTTVQAEYVVQPAQHCATSNPPCAGGMPPPASTTKRTAGTTVAPSPTPSAVSEAHSTSSAVSVHPTNPQWQLVNMSAPRLPPRRRSPPQPAPVQDEEFNLATNSEDIELDNFPTYPVDEEEERRLLGPY